MKNVILKERFSRLGICIVDGCESYIKAKMLCGKHYARMRRRRSKEVELPSVERCLAVGCSESHYKNGYCEDHNDIYKKVGYPHMPKVVKLCGVGKCSNAHFGRGLCKSHYKEWMENLKKHQLMYQLKKNYAD